MLLAEGEAHDDAECTVAVDSLEDLVDVAIDSDRRVIEDPAAGEYVVFDGTTRYRFSPEIAGGAADRHAGRDVDRGDGQGANRRDGQDSGRGEGREPDRGDGSSAADADGADAVEAADGGAGDATDDANPSDEGS